MNDTSQLTLFQSGMAVDSPAEIEKCKAARREGERRRDRAHDIHERHRRVFLLNARREAINVALAKGEVDPDDVRERTKLPANKNPTCYGNVCKNLARLGVLKFDRFTRSRRPEAHARDIRVWKLADQHKAKVELEVIDATLAILERGESPQ